MINKIRNFAIIAHVDHGKSTLADRFLEITDTVPLEKMKEQYLDQNPISRERGITIKLAPVRMNYTLNAINYTLNLIDTPGHVDFSYEVSRTLACCEGAILLVDATQGIQAQTVAHLREAKKENLKIIPVINKIDLENAEPEITAKALCNDFGFSQEEIIYVSAKTGENVRFLLEEIIKRIPPPRESLKEYLRALVFDAVYDEHKGVVAFIRVFDQKVKKGDRIELLQTKTQTEALDIGYFTPFLKSSDELNFGEIGYIVTGIKNIRLCNVGDTITIQSSKLKVQSYEKEIEALPGYRQPKPMVFFGVYPKTNDELIPLKEGLEKISLIDSSLSVSEEHSLFLGNGFRVGFLGLLHAEIIKERLKKEYSVNPLLTRPSVLYEFKGEKMFEPYMKLAIFTPNEYVGNIITVCQKKKGNFINISYHENYVVLDYEMPYSMFIRGISSDIKSVSQGFASLDYDLLDYRGSDLVNLEIRVNDNPIDVLSEFVYRDELSLISKEKTKKLKESLPRQQFRQVIQAVCEGKIIAREEIPPFRKDVIAKLSGGDRTRKDKLLKKQKKGKERMFTTSKIDIPQEALYSFLDRK